MGCSRVETCMDVSSVRHDILEFHGIPYRLIGSIKAFFRMDSISFWRGIGVVYPETRGKCG